MFMQTVLEVCAWCRPLFQYQCLVALLCVSKGYAGFHFSLIKQIWTWGYAILVIHQFLTAILHITYLSYITNRPISQQSVTQAWIPPAKNLEINAILAVSFTSLSHNLFSNITYAMAQSVETLRWKSCSNPDGVIDIILPAVLTQPVTEMSKKVKRESVPVTGLRGLEGSRRLRFPHFMTFGKVVTPYAPAAFTPRNILVLIFRSWVDPGHMDLSDASETIPSDTTGDRSRDLPTSSAAP